MTYLCVDYSSHPEAFARPGHGQHGPQEDQNGQDEGEERGRHNVVEDDDEVAQHLRFGHHGVVQGKQQLEKPRQRLEKLVRLWDFLVFKHAAETEPGKWRTLNGNDIMTQADENASTDLLSSSSLAVRFLVSWLRSLGDSGRSMLFSPSLSL